MADDGSDNGNGNRLPMVLFIGGIILWIIIAALACYIIWELPWHESNFGLGPSR